MTGGDIATICVLGTVVPGALLPIMHWIIEDTADKLWPRGLRWFPGLWLDTEERLHRFVLRIFWPEKRVAFKGRRLLRLEAWDAEWRTWNDCSGSAGIPVWKPWREEHPDDGRWTPREQPRLCPCGYGDECAIWCGPSHINGGCPEHGGMEEL